MPRTLVTLMFAALLLAAQRDLEQQIVQLWIDNARSHEPGMVDRPLRVVANQPPGTFDLVCVRLQSTLSRMYDVRERNDIRRRGALLHTDIAMLLPERAADFTQADLILTMRGGRNSQPNQKQAEGDSVVLGADGEYVSSMLDNAHWWMASYLLRGIQPHPNEDGFVVSWNRAIAAFFESHSLYGSADHHLSRALIAVPADPVLLFYAGTLHEAYGSTSIQSVLSTRPTSVGPTRLGPARDEWRQAEKYFGDSVKLGGPREARLRLARVKGQLGNHAEAAAMLRDVVTTLTDPRLKYFAYLFLGTEEGALAHIDESRQSFERAARMQPTAQSPLLGIAEMYRRTGNLSAAQETLQRLAALPDDRQRQDPYIDYFRSFAFDADEQLAAVRAMVKESR